MLHAASLMHDDVIDESLTRRGSPSANAAFGNKVSIFLFASRRCRWSARQPAAACTGPFPGNAALCHSLHALARAFSRG